MHVKKEEQLKKIICTIAIIALVASSAFGAPFAPEPLKISAQANILYAFDGSTLTIPVTLTGTPASTLFTVFTNGKASSIANVVNGFLGWHHVNKIDTCVYLSEMMPLVKGTNSVQWNGKNDDGAKVDAGTYTYYLWGFDNVNPRIQATKSFSLNPWNFRTIVTHNIAGAPLAQPIIYRGSGGGNANAAKTWHTNYKWTIGGDPLDATLLETCQTEQQTSKGGLAFDPKNAANFFLADQIPGGIQVLKWTWVPNGKATTISSWGDDGRFFYPTEHGYNGYWGPGVVSDGADLLWAVNADAFAKTTATSELIYIDVNDGTELKRFDLAPWWVDVKDGEAGGQTTGGPSEVFLRNKMLFLGSHSSCINQMLDPYAADDEDVVLWTNGNGDIIGDHNFETNAQLPWVCNDYVPGPYKYNFVADANNFSMFPSFDMGAVSFGLYAPDGTGVDYLAMAGETAKQKYGIEYIDYGSVYDGIYCTNNDASVVDATLWYVGHDSIKGIISDRVGVASDAPAAFSVAQNSPNPFNPTTTISFTLTAAAKTTVDVYNVAGQKVDTLVNGSMSAGSHSVVWNASKFSAGVYFYTVKSGSFSKTIKMTLLK
jgi:hypothetical protein